MPVCAFCGQDNLEGARSCVACGFVFADRPPEPEAAPGSAPSSAVSSDGTPAEEAVVESGPSPVTTHLATLYDPREVAKQERQALVMLALAAALAIAVGIAVLGDAATARDTISETPFLIDGPTITPRTDLLTVAELSMLAGALVMLGGWSQQVAANRALLDVSHPRHSARWALLAWLIPGPNIVLPGTLAHELWGGTAPRGEPAHPPALVRVWAPLFGVALALRYVGLLYGFLSSAELKTGGDVTTATAILVVPLVLWLLALAATAALVRALTARQLNQAQSLAA